MRGTILCGVDDSEAARSALELAAELSDRLDLRLVVAHVADGIARVGGEGEGDSSVTARAEAARLVARLSAEHDVMGSVEQRSAVGDPAALLGRIAAEEAADVIVIGSRGRGRLRRGLASKLARRLETESPVPVLIALPRSRRPQSAAA